MAEVEIRNITKLYGDVKALDNVNLKIPNGSFVVLLGPTGAGKTTTLRLISGLDKTDTGEVFIDGENVNILTPAQRNVAMVFQQYSLYPHLTVRENLEFPLKSPLLNTSPDEIKAIVESVAKMLSISHKLDNKSTTLSGGEMQRVSIGRALVRKPSIYLMDEPLSSLDAKLRSDLRIELKVIQEKSGATLLYVTHDQIEAMTMATHIGVLKEGRLVQFGTPVEIYENPNSTYVASRLGQPHINILPTNLFDNMPKNAKFIGLRPEHIIQGDDNLYETKVHKIERLGDQTHLHLRFKNHDIVTITDAHTTLQQNDVVKITLKNPHFFDSNGDKI